MSKYLFMYTIGPVQSFIEQARKTQDLFAGSRILSRLSEAGMGEIMGEIKDKGGEIIFPAACEGKDISYPNRLVALIDTDDINAFGKGVDTAVKNYFAVMLPKEENIEKAKIETAKQQMMGHLNTFWVAQAYTDGDYAAQYSELEKNMRSIKGLRTFSQIGQDYSQGRKCKLCGQRIALFEGKKYEKNYVLSKNEALCGVCYTKRRYLDEENGRKTFPSISEIALAYWIQALENGKGESLKNYKECFEQFSEQYFYYENVTGDVIEPKKNLGEVRGKLAAIDTYMKQKYPGILKRKYYAVIAFDGDSMGKWMSGAYFSGEKPFKDSQKSISGFLGEYAAWVNRYLTMSNDKNASVGDEKVNSRLGSVVYAGGEDFLGIVPLDNLLEVLKELRSQFKCMISDRLSKEGFSGSEFTFSAGVCIAHYKTPLNIVLSETRRMEKKAKLFREDKDSVAISIMKRSGELSYTAFGWRKDGSEEYITDDIKAVSQKLKAGFSDKFLRNIVQTVRDISDAGVSMKDIRAEVLSDAYRFTERACLVEDSKKRMEEISQMQQCIKSLYDSFSEFKTSDNVHEYFSNALLLAEFIGREQNDN